MKTLRVALLLTALALRPALAADDPFADLKTFDGQDRRPTEAVWSQIDAAGQDKAQLAAIEAKLIDVLKDPAAVPAGKQEACRLLWSCGSAACVPALAALLADDKTADMARYGLERNGSPEAGAALRRALATAKGKTAAGLLISLARRHDTQVVAIAKGLAGDPDALVADAAVFALGGAGTPDALGALQGLPKSAAVGQAIAACCAQLAATGQTEAAGRGYAALWAGGWPDPVREAALRGLADTSAPGALDAAIAGLSDKDWAVARVAGRLAAVLKDPQTGARYVAAFGDLDPALQLIVLNALADKGDPAVGPLATKGLTSTDAGLRAAAMRAAAAGGGAEAVKLLTDILLKGGRDDQNAARGVLARMKSPEAAAAIADLAANGEPAVRLEMIALLADRGAVASVPLLLTTAGGPDAKLALAACKSLGKLAGAAQYGDVVGVYLKAGSEKLRDAASQAVIAVARRVADAAKGNAPLLAAYPAADADLKASLLGVLASIGGDQALALLKQAAADPNLDLRRAAVDALADTWEDGRAAETLLAVAKAETDADLKRAAFKGYVRVLSGDDAVKPADKVARLAEALALAPTTAERKQVLAAVKFCRVAAAAELAASCLDDKQVAAEAASAIMFLDSTQHVEGKTYPAVKGPAIDAAVAKAQGKMALPAPWRARDVGEVGAAGAAAFADEAFTLTNAGWDIEGNADAMEFVSQPLTGDVCLTAHVARADNTNAWAKAGVMLRDGLSADAVNVLMAVTPGSGGTFQRRLTAGAGVEYTQVNGPRPPYWVKLNRRGQTVTGYLSKDGQTWDKIGSVNVKFGAEAVFGLAWCTHDAAKKGNATFDHVTVGPAE
jgi:HEAT repeat protein